MSRDKDIRVAVCTVNYIEIQKRTAKAILVKFEEDEEAQWVPLSQVDLDEPSKAMEMPQWLYDEKFK